MKRATIGFFAVIPGLFFVFPGHIAAAGKGPIFGAVVIMVVIITLITPIASKWSLGKRTRKREG